VNTSSGGTLAEQITAIMGEKFLGKIWEMNDSVITMQKNLLQKKV
jgi:hypothetical protein